MSSSSKESSIPIGSRLLAALPRDEYERLLPNSQVTRLPRNRILYEAGDEVGSAYFISQGMVSMLAITEDGQTVDICTVGKEGVVGLPMVLNVPIMPCRVVTQLPCEARLSVTHCIPFGRDCVVGYWSSAKVFNQRPSASLKNTSPTCWGINVTASLWRLASCCRKG